MRLVFAGTPEAALPSLDALAASRHEVLAVVTRPDAPAGRGRRLSASPVAVRAEQLGIEVLKPTTPREPGFHDRLRQLAPDACPVVAYGGLLPQSVLEIPARGWINLHFSLLPRWRGAAPVQRAVIAGDTQIGTSCFRIVQQLDAGDVYLATSQVMPEATAGELIHDLARSGARELLETMTLVEEGTQPRSQPLEGITLAPKVTVAEAQIRWCRPAEEIRRLIMGCSPEPGAWCALEGRRLKIYRARLGDGQHHDLKPGQLHATKHQLFAGTGAGALELLEVQAPGKRRMPAADWARAGVAAKVLT